MRGVVASHAPRVGSDAERAPDINRILGALMGRVGEREFALFHAKTGLYAAIIMHHDGEAQRMWTVDIGNER